MRWPASRDQKRAWGSAFQLTNQHPHRWKRAIVRIFAGELRQCRSRGRHIAPLQRRQHVVAQHHVTVVGEDVELLHGPGHPVQKS
ncbi:MULTISPECIES: hypothetical protein [Paraburkholderia]|uniref:hypothetical protein n=1 Tax=Paraburkholderia TaxID=1822464 RepID=UPI00037510C9|nr:MULTISPECIES: hypothetical protein [Paraburkholderia]MDH6147580.1 hypothetical protein [Paraburkholderia sp. WSM4179]